MTIRSDKHKGKWQFPISKDNSDIFRYGQRLSYADFMEDKSNIYTRDYNIKELQDIILSNIYHSRCITMKLECICGKGFSEDTDPEIIKAWDSDQVYNWDEQFLNYGEAWNELTILRNQVINILNVPTMSMTLGKKDKYANKAIQFYGKDNEQTFPLFDEELYKSGKHPNGVFMHQIKFGRKIYGYPAWIPAMELLKIMKYSLEDVAAFYENDAIPYTAVIANGMDVNTETGESILDYLEQNFQGAKKKRKNLIMASSLSKQDAGIEFKEMAKKIVDKDYLELINSMKFDVCAMHGTPYWLLGLTKAGSLGNTQEREVELLFFISEVVQTDRKWITKTSNIYFPDKYINFEDIKMPESSQPDFNMDEVVMESKARINNFVKEIMTAENLINN